MRGLRTWSILGVLVGLFVIAGCGKQDLLKPPQIHYGRDVCAQCRMIIADERFAGAAVTASGQFLKFDDIGCLAAYEKEQNGRVIRSWVRDASGGGWIEREKALFVYAPNLVTPMGYGVAAFEAEKDAQQFSQEKAGRVAAWSELLNLTENQNHLAREDVP